MSQPEDRLAHLSADEKRKLLAELLQKKASQTKAEYPLSYSQRAMWFLHKLAPDSAAYNVAFAARIVSPVNVDKLRRVFQDLVNRHPMLRASFPVRDGQPIQEIRGYADVDFQQVNAVGWDATHLNQQLDRVYAQPFDLEQGPVLRVRLFTSGTAEHILLIAAHHIVFDGWSVWVFLDEFRQLYQGQALPGLTAHYPDFVRWQTELLASAEGERLWAYWHKQLGGELPVLNLPTDQPRPLTQTFNGKTHSFVFRPELSQRLRELARSEQTTLYTVLVTAFCVLLYRYSNQEDIVIGSPMAGRNRPEFAGVVGDFINMVVLRANLSGAPTFRVLLAQMRQTVLDALTHQDYPMPLLAGKLITHPDPSRSPLYQIAFDLQRVHHFGELTELFVQGKGGGRVTIGDLVLEPYPMSQQEGQLDLSIQLLETSEVLAGGIKYNTDLFTAETIARLTTHFETLLTDMVANSDRRVNELALLTDAERHQLVFTWNQTRMNFPADKCIHQLVEEQVERVPDLAAVIFENTSLSYRDLNRRANQLANYLRARGVGPETIVAIAVERSMDMIVGVLGVLKAGGAYLPLDINYPAERLAFMLADSQAHVLLCHSRLKNWVATLGADACQTVYLDADLPAIARENDGNLVCVASSENLAYVIYTSGSTGKPKGTLLPHRGLNNFATWLGDTFQIKPGKRVLQFSSASFDASVWEIFMALRNGGTLCLARQEMLASSFELARVLREQHITTTILPPSMLALLSPDNLPDLETVTAGGEACPREIVTRWAPGRKFFNAYGPTETTVCASVALCDENDPRPPTIGKPIYNTQLYILDANLQPVPIGVPGELCIGGVGVGRGYLNRPELTESKFVPHPFSDQPGARLYRTGDLCRFRADGNIEYLGRIDQQVKLRGLRVELGEVESNIRQYSMIQDCAVIAREDRLVAYLVVTEHANLVVQELRDWLAQRLPNFMIPSAFMILDALPLSPSGKVNRRALPEIDRANLAMGQAFVAPRTPVEEVIADIWAQVLDVEQVGVMDNFFELGGHSLLATQVVSRMREAFQITLPLQRLFEAPTVAGLAAIILQDPNQKTRIERIARVLLRVTKLSDEQVSTMLNDKGLE